MPLWCSGLGAWDISEPVASTSWVVEEAELWRVRSLMVGFRKENGPATLDALATRPGKWLICCSMVRGSRGAYLDSIAKYLDRNPDDNARRAKNWGKDWTACCPFHNEKTPSFTVSPAKGIYKCFGCGKAGNSVDFIMNHEQLTYPEALRFLAKKYNIQIEEDASYQKERDA